MDIRLLSDKEKPPIDLLLSADPSLPLVMEYLEKGDCFVAESDKQVIGVYEIGRASCRERV